MARPSILFYHDGRHPLIYMYEPPMQREELEAAIDELVGTPVEAILFCLGDGRTLLHNTKVGELWGHNVSRWPHPVFRRASQNARQLIDAGHDPLAVICARAHQKGLLVYPTLLVQQGRGPRESDVRCSEFRFKNTHLEIGADGDLPADFPGFTGLDFMHEEVREERFAVIQETLTGYDIDGFELQLNYMPYYFHPNDVEKGRTVLTDWIRQVYQAVKQSGSERELIIRIPASIEGCYGLGLDVKTWIEQGIVDALVGQAFSGPELLHPMLNFKPLVQAAWGTKTRILGALQSLVDSDRMGEATIEVLRGAACNYWSHGIDGLYLAHWFGNWPYDASFYEKLRELPHPDVMATKDKCYFLPTETGRYPIPTVEPGLSLLLPATLETDKSVRLPFSITDDLPRWSAVGRIHEVILRIRVMNVTEQDHLEFVLNRQLLPERQLRKINEVYRMKAPRYRTGSGYWFVFRLDRGTWPVRGANNLTVTLKQRDADLTMDAVLRDVEIEVRYLMGKQFNRGQDPDLGPTDWWNT